MGWIRKSKEQMMAEISKSALGHKGDIVVVISGTKLDPNVVTLGCWTAKGAGRKIHLIYVVEVPRSLSLKAVQIKEAERADAWLNEAMKIAAQVNCRAIPMIVQAREAGPAIVDEVRDHGSALLFIGICQTNQTRYTLDKTVAHVLANSPCRVWLVQDLVKPVEPLNAQ